MSGRGFDRHLLGLRLLLRPMSGEAAPLLDDELFGRSQKWKLSTSGLSAGLLFKGTGFGTSYEDGYGINCVCFSSFEHEVYLNFGVDLAAPEMVKFGIESKFSCPKTSTEVFKKAVVRAMEDLKALCEGAILELEQTATTDSLKAYL